jgi:hypothetical protein
MRRRWSTFALCVASAVGCGRIEYLLLPAVPGDDGGIDGSRSDDGGSDDAARFDSGAFDDGGGIEDGAIDASGPVDGAREAAADDACSACRPVTVTSRVDGAFVPGQQVLFHDASGRFLAETTTDAAGRASGDIPVDGMVTTVAISGTTMLLTSIAGAQPGEDLLIESAPWVPTVDVDVSLPVIGGASAYGIALPCGLTPVSRTGLVVGAYRPSCARGARFDGVAIAYDTSQVPIAYSVVRDVDVGTALITFPAWQTALTTVTGSVSGVPAPFYAAELWAAPIVLGQGNEVAAFYGFAGLASGAASVDARVGAPVSDDWIYSLVGLGGALPGSRPLRTRELRRAPFPPPALTLSMALLPAIESASSAIVGGRLEATFGIGPVPDADAVHVLGGWPASSGRFVAWQVLGPPGARILTSPELPPSLATWAPIGAPAGTSVAVLDSSRADGWDELRTTTGTTVLDPTHPLLTGGTDRLRISSVELF